MLSSQDLGWLVEMRHHLHRHPELSCAEEQTAPQQVNGAHGGP